MGVAPRRYPKYEEHHNIKPTITNRRYPKIQSNDHHKSTLAVLIQQLRDVNRQIKLANEKVPYQEERRRIKMAIQKELGAPYTDSSSSESESDEEEEEEEEQQQEPVVTSSPSANSDQIANPKQPDRGQADLEKFASTFAKFIDDTAFESDEKMISNLVMERSRNKEAGKADLTDAGRWYQYQARVINRIIGILKDPTALPSIPEDASVRLGKVLATFLEHRTETDPNIVLLREFSKSEHDKLADGQDPTSHEQLTFNIRFTGHLEEYTSAYKKAQEEGSDENEDEQQTILTSSSTSVHPATIIPEVLSPRPNADSVSSANSTNPGAPTGSEFTSIVTQDKDKKKDGIVTIDNDNDNDSTDSDDDDDDNDNDSNADGYDSTKERPDDAMDAIQGKVDQTLLRSIFNNNVNPEDFITGEMKVRANAARGDTYEALKKYDNMALQQEIDKVVTAIRTFDKTAVHTDGAITVSLSKFGEGARDTLVKLLLLLGVYYDSGSQRLVYPSFGSEDTEEVLSSSPPLSLDQIEPIVTGGDSGDVKDNTNPTSISQVDDDWNKQLQPDEIKSKTEDGWMKSAPDARSLLMKFYNTTDGSTVEQVINRNPDFKPGKEYVEFAASRSRITRHYLKELPDDDLHTMLNTLASSYRKRATVKAVYQNNVKLKALLREDCIRLLLALCVCYYAETKQLMDPFGEAFAFLYPTGKSS